MRDLRPFERLVVGQVTDFHLRVIGLLAIDQVLHALRLEEVLLRDRARHNRIAIHGEHAGKLALAHPVGKQVVLAGAVTNLAVNIAEFLQHVKQQILARGQRQCQRVLQEGHAVHRIQVNERLGFYRVYCSLAHRPEPIRGSLQLPGEIFQAGIEALHVLARNPHVLHADKRRVAFIRPLDKFDPQGIHHVLAVIILVLARLVQVHRHGKRIALSEDVTRKAMHLGNVARLETRRPRVLERVHALAAGTNLGACEGIDVVFVPGVARHGGKHLRFGRRFQLVLRSKPATIIYFEPAGIHPDGGKEPAFEHLARLDAPHPELAGGGVAEKRFGMQVLAPLVNLVEHAEQGRRRERILPHERARRRRRIFTEGNPAVTKRGKHRRTEIPDTATHGNHELRGIRIDIELAFHGNHRFHGVKGTQPLEFHLATALVQGGLRRN